jgi:hypothetical protein
MFVSLYFVWAFGKGFQFGCVARKEERGRALGFWMALAESKVESKTVLNGEQHSGSGSQTLCFQPQKVWLSH